MENITVKCPNCKSDIKLTESLAAPFVETLKVQYEAKIAEKEATFVSERAKISKEEAKKAREALDLELSGKSNEIKELNELLKSRNEKLKLAQDAQAELLRKTRELDDARREMDLTIEKSVQEKLLNEREKAKKEAEEELTLKVKEKELTISSMAKQIEELKRKAEQGSQQLQGEAQEIVIEEMLRSKFPNDVITPVPKGEHGGDAIHRVIGANSRDCGAILWESKRTKNWSDGWISKAKEDLRAAKGDMAIIVTRALPKEIDSFDLVDGVWVTSPRHAIPVAIVLRQTLMDVQVARQANEGQGSKMELTYRYLTGPQFKQRVQTIVEKFSEMHEDLLKERKSMIKIWAKREEQIKAVIIATAGMHGDLQAIAGKTLEEIEGLSLDQIAGPS